MGGTTFETRRKGLSAQEAFRAATEAARHEYGHNGYSGTVGEKHDFVIIGEPAEDMKRALVQKMLEGAERSVAYYRAEAEKRRNIPAGDWGYPHRETWAKQEEEQAARAAVRVEKLKSVLAAKERVPFALVANEYADKLIEEGDRRIADKWGPAGCIVLREPDRVKRLTKAAAEKLATEKYGAGAIVTVKRRDRRAWARIELKGKVKVESRDRFTRPTERLVESVSVAAQAEGEDASEAYGRLFAGPGEYLFFGWASS